MAGLIISMLGRFRVRRDAQVVHALDVRKAQEVFSYLLLHRGHSHSRELLAGLLWRDSSTDQSRKYLRQALWQLQTALVSPSDGLEDHVLQIEPDWVGLNPRADLWLDVEAFEQAFTLSKGVPPQELTTEGARALEAAVQLYQGDLLEGCYLDWCLFERVRLQSIYLTLLDKLMGFCETHHDYEAGLLYGMRILSCDRASERTHRRLMRLKCLVGDRTAALRQYKDCVDALEEELGVRPSRSTHTLYEQILADQFESSPGAEPEARATPEAATNELSEISGSLQQVVRLLSDLQRQLQAHLDRIELTLRQRR